MVNIQDVICHSFRQTGLKPVFAKEFFPSITKDYFGAQNFGMNYGLVFTAWGVGGFMLAKLAGTMYDKYETFNIAYYGASGLLVLAAIMVFFVKPPHRNIEAVPNKS